MHLFLSKAVFCLNLHYTQHRSQHALIQLIFYSDLKNNKEESLSLDTFSLNYIHIIHNIFIFMHNNTALMLCGFLPDKRTIFKVFQKVYKQQFSFPFSCFITTPFSDEYIKTSQNYLGAN